MRSTVLRNTHIEKGREGTWEKNVGMERQHENEREENVDNITEEEDGRLHADFNT